MNNETLLPQRYAYDVACMITIPDGTTCTVAHMRECGGQVTCMRWLCVQIDGPWIEVDFHSTLKLKAIIEACSTREELEEFVINGSQTPPYRKVTE